MRSAFRFAVWLLLLWGSAGVAHASYDDSRTWFERLSAAERAATQSELILAGHYENLVDGEFGRGTFDAIAAFQRSEGRAGTGVLTDFERRRLRTLAGAVRAGMGMEEVLDREARVTLTIPGRLLSIRATAEAGTSYVSEDGEISLQTMHASLADQPFEQLFEVMTSPDPERIVTYQSFGAGRFVVSGRIGDYSFYSMFLSSGGEAFGYSLAWGEGYATQGRIASVYVASHFTPLGSLPEPPPRLTRTDVRADSTARSAFSLPEEHPQVILLDADIIETTPADFDRAIAARPGATILALNSPGGSVHASLRIASQVRQRGMTTYVPPGMGCYSACAFVFLAGAGRQAVGELGVHQISAEVADLVLAQSTLGDVLDAMQEFGVPQQVISRMLRTPPDDMYVFTEAELGELGIARGEALDIVLVAATPVEAGGAYVQLSRLSSATEAERSRAYVEGRWSALFGEERAEVQPAGDIYEVRVATPSVERADAICAAIKADGGGCYVTAGS